MRFWTFPEIPDVKTLVRRPVFRTLSACPAKRGGTEDAVLEMLPGKVAEHSPPRGGIFAVVLWAPVDAVMAVVLWAPVDAATVLPGVF